MSFEAVQERFLACLRDVVLEIAKDAVAQARELDEWVDQYTSPLGKSRHLRLCRSGKLTARKQGKKWLVHRDDMNGFIAADASSSRSISANGGDDVDRDLRDLGIPMPGSEDAKPTEPRRSRKAKRRR